MSPTHLSSRLLHPFQLLNFLFQLLGVRGEMVEIIQAPETLSVAAGEEFTLHCILSGIGQPGDVMWHKDLDRNQLTIYSEREESSPRVTRLFPGSDADFSITISNFQFEDAGTYYCVKYSIGTREVEKVSGKGTVVSVLGTPSQPLILGPLGRVESGALVTFRCISKTLFPRNITVTWLKDGRSIQPLQTTVWPKGQHLSYTIWTSVKVELTKEDVKSQLICQIEHRTLQSPLRQSFRLGDILRVPPDVRVETDPLLPAQLNETVNISCKVENFYPNNISVLWFENGHQSESRRDDHITQHWDGTFSLKSSLAVKATEERNLSTFTCQVTHDVQTIVEKTATLVIQSIIKKDRPLYSVGLWTGIFLNKIVTSIFLVVLFLRRKHSKTTTGSKAGGDQGSRAAKPSS